MLHLLAALKYAYAVLYLVWRLKTWTSHQMIMYVEFLTSNDTMLYFGTNLHLCMNYDYQFLQKDERYIA
jgi:hypothetical protein